MLAAVGDGSLAHLAEAEAADETVEISARTRHQIAELDGTISVIAGGSRAAFAR